MHLFNFICTKLKTVNLELHYLMIPWNFATLQYMLMLLQIM